MMESSKRVEKDVIKILADINAPSDVRLMAKKISFRVWNDGKVSIKMPDGSRVRLTFDGERVRAEVA